MPMKPVNENSINFNYCTTQTSKLHERRAGTCRKTVSAGRGSLSDDISHKTRKQRRYPNIGYRNCIKSIETQSKKKKN